MRQGGPLPGGPNATAVGALPGNGPEAVMPLDGALNRDSFAAYPEQVPGPTLRPGDVVAPDNLRVHQAAGMHERSEACGGCLCPCTRPISAPSKTAGASSERGCARPRPAPVKPWTKSFARP